MGKKVVVNRAPVMVAWCTIVAERLGFNRQEALSIGTSPLLALKKIHEPPLVQLKCIRISIALQLEWHEGFFQLQHSNQEPVPPSRS